MVTAGGEGTAFVKASVASLVDSSEVTVVSASGVPPDFEEDFSSYTTTAHMLSDPRNIYSTEDDTNSGISLDTSMGVGALTQSMKYTYPNRTGSGGRCNDFSITRGIRFDRAGVLGRNVQEYWWEIYVRFSANFTTVAPSSWNCTSNKDFKVIVGGLWRAGGRG